MTQNDKFIVTNEGYGNIRHYMILGFSGSNKVILVNLEDNSLGDMDTLSDYFKKGHRYVSYYDLPEKYKRDGKINTLLS